MPTVEKTETEQIWYSTPTPVPSYTATPTEQILPMLPATGGDDSGDGNVPTGSGQPLLPLATAALGTSVLLAASSRREEHEAQAAAKLEDMQNASTVQQDQDLAAREASVAAQTVATVNEVTPYVEVSTLAALAGVVKETFTGVWEDAVRISAADAPITIVTHNWVNGVDPEKRLQEIAENDAFIAAYYQNVYLPNKEKEEKRQEAIQWLADNKARTDEAARIAKEQEIAKTIAAQKAAAWYKKMTRDEEYTEDKNVFQIEKFNEAEARKLVGTVNKNSEEINGYELSKTGVDVVGAVDDVYGMKNFFTKTAQVLGIIQDPNVTAASMKAKDIVQMYVDGRLTEAQMEKFLYLNNKWRGNRTNWTTFKEMITEGKASSLNVASLVSFGASVGGWILGDEKLKAKGDLGQTIAGVLEGTKELIVNTKWIGKGEVLARSVNEVTLKGSILPVLKIAAGSIMYATSVDKLIFDADINPKATGNWDNDTWNKRISVVANGIGGALLAGSGLALLGTAGAAAPVSAVLGAGSLLCFGLGYLLERI
jgi:hypothetical protein